MNGHETEIDLGDPRGPARMVRRPLHLWFIAILSLVWNIVSAMDYLLTQSGNAAYLSQFTGEQLAYVTSFPAWVHIGWAFSVWGSLTGSVLLLLRKRQAFTAFALSILGMIATGIWQFALAPRGPVEIMGTASLVMTLLIWIVALALLMYAFDMRRRAVLR